MFLHCSPCSPFSLVGHCFKADDVSFRIILDLPPALSSLSRIPNPHYHHPHRRLTSPPGLAGAAAAWPRPRISAPTLPCHCPGHSPSLSARLFHALARVCHPAWSEHFPTTGSSACRFCLRPASTGTPHNPRPPLHTHYSSSYPLLPQASTYQPSTHHLPLPPAPPPQSAGLQPLVSRIVWVT